MLRGRAARVPSYNAVITIHVFAWRGGAWAKTSASWKAVGAWAKTVASQELPNWILCWLLSCSLSSLDSSVTPIEIFPWFFCHSYALDRVYSPLFLLFLWHLIFSLEPLISVWLKIPFILVCDESIDDQRKSDFGMNPLTTHSWLNPLTTHYWFPLLVCL